jgi:hypothetical protein
MDKYEITKEQILQVAAWLELAEGIGTLKELRSWFPSAFEEWEEVPLAECSLVCFTLDGPMLYHKGNPVAFLNYSPDANYKIEPGRILRRKSAG